eukprot:m.47860 g.47860  ORF g.47860 m.47860 type:complete len:81 (-) comp13247_c0_seq10:249-491(-)
MASGSLCEVFDCSTCLSILSVKVKPSWQGLLQLPVAGSFERQLDLVLRHIMELQGLFFEACMKMRENMLNGMSLTQQEGH